MGKLFSNHIFYKGIISKIYKELIEFSGKKIKSTIDLKIGRRIDIFPK